MDYSLPPWTSLGKVSTIKPNAAELRAEVLHCISLDNNILIHPHPKALTITQTKYWLSKHPITVEEDIASIKKIIAEQKNVAEMAMAEKASKTRDLLSSSANWIGKYPILHLIHALVDHDEIKRSFLTCHDLTRGCISIENRNTEDARASSVWQLIADK